MNDRDRMEWEMVEWESEMGKKRNLITIFSIQIDQI